MTCRQSATQQPLHYHHHHHHHHHTPSVVVDSTPTSHSTQLGLRPPCLGQEYSPSRQTPCGAHPPADLHTCSATARDRSCQKVDRWLRRLPADLQNQTPVARGGVSRRRYSGLRNFTPVSTDGSRMRRRSREPLQSRTPIVQLNRDLESRSPVVGASGMTRRRRRHSCGDVLVGSKRRRRQQSSGVKKSLKMTTDVTSSSDDDDDGWLADISSSTATTASHYPDSSRARGRRRQQQRITTVRRVMKKTLCSSTGDSNCKNRRIETLAVL